MAIWGRLKTELDRASRVAQDAIDEGRVRLEIFRARQRADRAAQTLGYALYRARRGGNDLDAAAYDGPAGEITRAEEEIARLEGQLSDARGDAAAPSPADQTEPAPPASAS